MGERVEDLAPPCDYLWTPPPQPPRLEWREKGCVVEDGDSLMLVRWEDLPKLAAVDLKLAARIASLDLERMAAYERQWELEGPHA